MVLTKSQQKVREIIKKHSQKQVIGVDEKRLKEIIDDFYYNFAPKHKFYGRPGGGTTREVELAVEENGYFMFAWQDDIVVAMLTAVFAQHSWDILISVLRQVGKTEVVALVTAYIFENFFKEFHVPCNIAVFAPVKNTATIMFKRSTQYINPRIIAPDGDTKEKKESLRGDAIQLFGIYDETKGSTIEGNTFDLIIRDEAHLGNDQKFSDETEPTRFAKKCPIVMIGNAGKRKCLFFEGLSNGEFHDKETDYQNVIIRYTYERAKPYLEHLASLGLQAAKTRIDNIENYIRKHGERSYDVQKNVFCRWKLEYGQVVTKAQLQRRLVKNTKWDKTSPLYMSIDIAKTHDRTIAIVMDDQMQIIDIIIVKDSYTLMQLRAQMETLKAYCDSLEYTEDIVAIGFDSTGAGSLGTQELLIEFFSGAYIKEYNFNVKTKNEWIKGAVETIQTEYEDNAVKIPEANPNTKIFLEEWENLTKRTLDSGYDVYEAPHKEGCFDDMCMSFAICVNLVRSLCGSYFKHEPLKDKELKKIAEYESPLYKYSHLLQNQIKSEKHANIVAI